MKESPATSPDISPATLNDFMNSLQRLFKIGLYYPSGHKILDSATERFLGLLAQLAGEKNSVIIHVSNNTLIIEEIELDGEQHYVRDFNAMLSTLGISSISISKLISVAELHDFIRKMSVYKAKVLGARKFLQVDVSDLPHSIEVEQKEFLARADSSLSDSDSGSADNLDSFIDSLAKHGLEDHEIQQCKTLLDNLPRQMTNSDIEIGDLPYASWDDVAKLLVRAVRGGKIDKDGKLLASSHSNINALAAILKKLELETKDRKSREAINMLVSIIRKPLEQSEDDQAEKEILTRRIFPDDPEINLQQIQSFADKHKLNSDILVKLPFSSQDKESLSILIQLAHFEQPLANQIRMQQLFRESLSKALSEKTWQILSGGLHSIAKAGNQNRLSATIRLLAEPIRRSPHSSTLYLLQQTDRLCDKEGSRLLWPHIVNELLVVGSSKDKIVYHNLCQIAARLPSEQMNEALPHLRNLEAFQDTKIASDIFLAVSPACYPLFAFLLKTEIERYIGERVLGGLRRHPRDWLIKGVVPLLDISQQEHKLFLYSYLRQAAQKTLSRSLKQIAANIIIGNLPLLSQEKRNEKWVTDSITALGHLPGEETTGLLKQITLGKKMLFIPDWPANCRSAAEKALAAT